jgi:hypothetical protein
MDKQEKTVGKQSQEHGYTVRHVMYIVAGLLVVGALMLAACGGAAKSVEKANEPAQAAGIVMPVNPAQSSCPPAGTAGKDVGRDFFVQVVGQLKDVPQNDFAVNALAAWEPYENTSAIWNPLATTWEMEVVCDFNSVHVQHYQNQDMGVRATANTLNLGYYDAIRKMLRGEAFDREGMRGSLGTWGSCSGQGCDSLLNEWQALWDGR